MKIDKKIPSYLQRANRGGLLIGFIYVLVFMSILFLWIWQTFESENNKSSMNLVDERLSIIEEQINIVDETNNDTITDISSSIQFLDKEIMNPKDCNHYALLNPPTKPTKIMKLCHKFSRHISPKRFDAIEHGNIAV